MAQLATINPIQPPAELVQMSTDKLRAALTAALARTVAQLTKLAWIVRILEERGEDLTDLRLGLMPYLRQIAYGQVLPEVVVRYAEHHALIRAISALPLPDQERLAKGEHVQLAVRRPDGTADHRMVDPLHLVRDQVSRVFARGRLRTLEEQIVLLEAAPAKPAAGTAPTTVSGVHVDRKRRGLRIGRKFVAVAAVTEALALLSGPADPAPESDDDDGRTVQFGFMLTEAEYDRIREAAHQGRTKMSTLTRQALRAAGLI